MTPTPAQSAQQRIDAQQLKVELGKYVLLDVGAIKFREMVFNEINALLREGERG